eukprot:CAMPEP_0184499004 /NCGR_PEP_ID=MMETSP0113_2-20130426/40404_1 /TAXON_ID=91329 /ORGANISM="Norrisiella sphaerica, Strain BC52" /LENGTH=302 /DNA_ID=CAMNT_0026886757 /DNA_START=77 /DNA_END=985 /DNA_ORIENTATION=+
MMEGYKDNETLGFSSGLDHIGSGILRAAELDTALGRQIKQDYAKRAGKGIDRFDSTSRHKMSADRRHRSPLSQAGSLLMHGTQRKAPNSHSSTRSELSREEQIVKHANDAEWEKLARLARGSSSLRFQTDREYRAGQTCDGVKPIINFEVENRTQSKVDNKLSYLASFAHDVAAPTHPHLVKGRGRKRLMRPLRNPILEDGPKRPIGKKTNRSLSRDPILEGEELDHKPIKKFLERKEASMEKREFKHVFTRKMIPCPFEVNRNPIMDFQAGPAPEQRPEKKRVEMWFDKNKPKNMPLGMLG